MKIKKTREDIVIDTVNTILLCLIIIVTLYPIVYVFSMSISGANAVLSNKVRLWPIGFSLESYKKVFEYPAFWWSYLNTVIYTAAGTFVGVASTVLCGYALSRRNFVLGKFVSIVAIITMLFSGGLIPSFIWVNKLGLYDNRWVLILPCAASAWYLMMTRVFMQTNIPDSLIDAAKIDGANDLHVLFRIVIPLSTTIIAILALFYAVGQWNGFFSALLYIKSESKKPLQIVLRDILIRNSAQAMIGRDETMIAKRRLYMEQLKYVSIMVSILPIMMVYPFLQKYFVKGIMIGAIKE